WNVFEDWYDFMVNEIYVSGDKVNHLGMTFVPIYRTAPNYKFLGFLREDSVNQKVYFYDPYSFPIPNLGSEKLLYDFDIEVGDTIDIFYREHDSNIQQAIKLTVDSIGIADKFIEPILGPFEIPPIIDDSARVYNLQPVGPHPSHPTPKNITWVEGVGSTAGPMRSGIGGSPVFTYDLVCFHQNGELAYYSVSNHNRGSDSCLALVTASIEPTEKPYSIYPNPAIDNLVIEHSSPAIEVKIFNSSAQLIYQAENIQAGIHEIKLTDWPKGIYFLKFQFGDRVASEKFILLE
ncbi:MAG: T9SS type A sorting domain-containing protein, partial [Bacteroidota bacterium]